MLKAPKTVENVLYMRNKEQSQRGSGNTVATVSSAVHIETDQSQRSWQRKVDPVFLQAHKIRRNRGYRDAICTNELPLERSP